MAGDASRQRMALVDTNVWMDYYLGHRPGSDAAKHFVDVALRADVELLVTVPSLKDLYYLLQSELKRNARVAGGEVHEQGAAAIKEVAWSCLNHVTELATVVAADMNDVWLARMQRSVHDDFEDDLVLAAMQRANALCLVTNDEQLAKHAPVVALDTKDAAAFLESRFL